MLLPIPILTFFANSLQTKPIILHYKFMIHIKITLQQSQYRVDCPVRWALTATAKTNVNRRT